VNSDTTTAPALPTRIAPWLSVADAAAAVEYYRAAFGAVERQREEHEGAVIVAHLSVGEADFWVQHDPESSPQSHEPGAVRMILTVDDPDAVFARAVAAGGTEVSAMGDGHGWHIGRIADPSGHHWEIGRPLAP